MTAIGWQARLNQAPTPEDVAEVCRQYLAMLSPAAMEGLPAPCRPAAPLDIGDISPCALKLIHQLDVGSRESTPVLHELTTFFTKAALRLAQIDAESEAPVRAARRG
jgi:hypothetical protein